MEFRCIGLVEFLWKIITGLLNLHFTSSIGFHDVLHGLRVEDGTGTASLEANMLQQLTAVRGAFIHDIFL